MALVVADRVKETTSTTGTGAVSLAGAELTFVTFSSVMSDGDTTYYTIVDNTNSEFEVGLGTYASSGNTLTRTTIFSSSNSNNAVNFQAGPKDVFLTYPADKSVRLDANGKIAENQTFAGTVTLNADPSSGLQAATKQYVDDTAAEGIQYHSPVRVEKEGNLSATYDNGTAGVGATLTNNSTQAALVIDGVTLSVNDRVLIYEQTDQTENGIYTVTNTGSASTNWVLTRATDADSYAPSDPNALAQGSGFFVQEGTAGAGEKYVCNTVGTITFGTTNITFVQVATAQIYTAGTGISISGSVISSDATLDEVTTSGATTSNAITVGNLTSTGIDDNASSTAITIASGGNTTFSGDVILSEATPAIKFFDTDVTDSSFSFVMAGATTYVRSRGGTSSYGQIRFQRSNDGSTNLSVFGTTTGGDVIFYDNDGSTEGLRWDASTSRLGLSDSTPATMLQVGNGDTEDSNAYITFGKRVASTENNLPFIGQDDYDGGSHSDLGIGARSTNGTINFYTGNAVAFTASKRRMSIEANGDVTIANDVDIGGNLEAGDGTNISMGSLSPGQLRLVGNGYQGAIALDATGMHIYHNSASRSIIFGTNETEQMRLDTNGDLGVGSSNPLARLHVNVTAASTGETDPLARFERFTTGDNHYLDIGVDNANNLVSFKSTGTSNGGFTFESASQEFLRVHSDGSVSVGTTVSNSSNRKLHLHEASSSGVWMQFTNTTTGTGSSDGAVIGFDGAEEFNIRLYENELIDFWTNNTQRMRIGNDGKIGIGTGSSAPQKELQINLASTTTTTVGNKGGIELYSASGTVGNGGELTWISGSGTTERWAAISGHIASNTVDGSYGDIVFAAKSTVGATSLTERMRVKGSGGGVSVSGSSGDIFTLIDTNNTASASDIGNVRIAWDDSAGTRVAYVGTVNNEDFYVLNGYGPVKLTYGGAVRFATSNDGIAVTGELKGEGPDGGMVMRSWPSDSGYGMIGTANMVAGEYALLTDGTNTFVAGGSGGSTYIRNGANDTSPQLVVKPASVDIEGGPLNVSGDITSNIASGNGLTINDTNATTQTQLNCWVSFQASGTEKGYVGYGSASTDKLYLTNYAGGTDVTASSGTVTLSGSSGINLASHTTFASSSTVDGVMKFDTGQGGNLIYEKSSSGGFIPVLAQHITAASTQTGALELQFPSYAEGASADMMCGWIDIYDYATNETQSYFVGGYLYQQQGQNEWTNVTVIGLATAASRDFTVRFGHDGTHHCIWIGELATTWSYCQVTARDWTIGYTADIDDYATNCDITFRNTSFPYVDETVDDNLVCAGRAKVVSNTDGSWYDTVCTTSDLLLKSGYSNGVQIHPSGGYLRAHYLNMYHPQTDRDSDTIFYSSTDEYIRKNSKSGMQSSLDILTTNTSQNITANKEFQNDVELRFGDSANVRMEFRASGDFYCRSYQHGGRLLFQGENSSGSNKALVYMDPDDATSLYHAGALKGYTYGSGWRVTGNLLATSDVYAYYSDERLKDKTGKIENALDKVGAIETFYYTHNDKAIELGYEDKKQQVGVSAQSVEAVMPEVVHLAPIDDDGEGNSKSGEDYKTVNYARLVPLLIESIKELRAEIEELKGGV